MSTYCFKLLRAPPRAWLIVALLAYWVLSLNRLDASPMVRGDEPWQTAPGYSLWTRGVYGSPLYSDFAGMGEHYYLFQPTFSLLLGLAARSWGLGLFQVRVVPVALGALTLCLTYAVGARSAGRAAGLVAVALLLLWRWNAGLPANPSGIVLLDESRIARYDALVPVWGLAACYVFMRARESRRARHFFATGALAGAAGLAHLYGIFWLPAFALVLGLDARSDGLRLRPFALIALGALLVWSPWLGYIALGWPDFVAQTSNYADRFDLLNPRFYALNLLYESRRYGFTRATLSQALLQPGVWLLLSLPILLAANRRRVRAALASPALLVPALLFPIAFALLLKQKTPGYLLSTAPLLAILAACLGLCLWRAHGRALRVAVLVAVLLLVLDGALGIARQLQVAGSLTPYHAFMARVRLLVPRTGRVLALDQYWLGLSGNDFRAYGDVFFLTNPDYTRPPLNLEQAFERVAPDFFVVDQILGNVIAEGDTPDGSPAAREFALRYHAYSAKHHARELGTLTDSTFGTLIVYQLSP